MSRDPKKFDAMLDATDPDFAEKFREAIGAKPGDTIEFVTPQFKREKGGPMPGIPPSTPEAWEALRGMSEAALFECGLRGWNKRADGAVLMLFPGEWYRSIPVGFAVVSIGGFEVDDLPTDPFEPGVSDNDIRFGCLPYGVVVRASRKGGQRG